MKDTSNKIFIDKKLKISLIVLLIILISIISFGGLFVQDTKFMNNLLPDYQLGMDLKGYRAITIAVNNEKETVYYDKDGKKVSEEVEGGASEEIPVNSEEVLTKENYEITKNIIEKRLNDLGVQAFYIRLNEENGTITVQLPEDNMTDKVSQFLYTKGQFTLENEEGQVLLDNSNLKEVRVGYTPSSMGTTVYLSLEFNDDVVEKLKEISNTYVKSTDEEGKDSSKEISINIDGSTLVETSFDGEIANGILSLTLGTSSDDSTLSSYLEQAANIAVLLNNETLPIDYNIDQNRFMKSDITFKDAVVPLIIFIAILILAFVVLFIKYKKMGLIAAISYLGYLAILLIVIRYTNLVITMEGICGILIATILNYILLVYILQTLKKSNKDLNEYKKSYNKSMLSMILVLIPTIIIGVVLCFSTWLPVYSFGTIIFWSILIMAIYNAFITRILFLNSLKEKH